MTRQTGPTLKCRPAFPLLKPRLHPIFQIPSCIPLSKPVCIPLFKSVPAPLFQTSSCIPLSKPILHSFSKLHPTSHIFESLPAPHFQTPSRIPLSNLNPVTHFSNPFPPLSFKIHRASLFQNLSYIPYFKPSLVLSETGMATSKELMQLARKRKAEEVLEQTASKIRNPGKRSGLVADIIKVACTYKYNKNQESPFQELPLNVFVILTETLNIQILRRFHRNGIPEDIIDEWKEQPLGIFWHTIHEKLEIIRNEWAFEFLSGTFISGGVPATN